MHSPADASWHFARATARMLAQAAGARRSAGELEASKLYLNRAEIPEMHAQAWDAAAVRDHATADHA